MTRCRTSADMFHSKRPSNDIFKWIFLNENLWISLKFVLRGPINSIPALVQIMAWRRPGDKPLSEPMMVKSLTHICVTRSQCVNSSVLFYRNNCHSGSETTLANRSKPTSRVFTQPFIQTQIKENVKAPGHWPLCGEFTGHRSIPRTNGQ